MVGRRGTVRAHRCPDSHKHQATGTCYNQHGCGCSPCVEARRVYQISRDKAIAYGRWDGAKGVDGLGTRRRLQALAFMGWPSHLIAAEVGTSPSHVRKLSRSDSLSPLNARRVAGAYKRIWDREPPGGRRKYTANLARRQGWLGPLAWDEIDTDPEPAPAERTQTPGESLLEDVAWLLESGEAPLVVAHRLGRKPGSIAKLAARAGDEELSTLFYAAENSAKRAA